MASSSPSSSPSTTTTVTLDPTTMHTPPSLLHQLASSLPSSPSTTSTPSPLTLTLDTSPDPAEPGAHSLFPWPCSLTLATFLHTYLAPFLSSNTSVLELGAGTALPSLVAALHGAHVCVTDQCTNALQRVPEQASQLEISRDLVACVELKWGEASSASLGQLTTWAKDKQLSLVLAADCWFDDECVEDFVSTLTWVVTTLGSKATVVLVAYEERSAMSTALIKALLRKWSWHCTEVPHAEGSTAVRLFWLSRHQ